VLPRPSMLTQAPRCSVASTSTCRRREAPVTHSRSSGSTWLHSALWGDAAACHSTHAGVVLSGDAAGWAAAEVFKNQLTLRMRGTSAPGPAARYARSLRLRRT
jgi:hypothetical protein